MNEQTKKFWVSLRNIQIEDIEVELPETATENELLEAAVEDVKLQLDVAKLDYWR